MEHADLCDVSECIDIDFSGENSTKKTAGEDSSSEEDLISCHLRFSDDSIIYLRKKPRNQLDENHSAPHIEFLSPPPEA